VIFLGGNAHDVLAVLIDWYAAMEE